MKKNDVQQSDIISTIYRSPLGFFRKILVSLISMMSLQHLLYFVIIFIVPTVSFTRGPNVILFEGLMRIRGPFLHLSQHPRSTLLSYSHCLTGFGHTPGKPSSGSKVHLRHDQQWARLGDKKDTVIRVESDEGCCVGYVSKVRHPLSPPCLPTHMVISHPSSLIKTGRYCNASGYLKCNEHSI